MARITSSRIASRFSLWHLWTAAALWLAFAVLTFWIASAGLDDVRDHPITVAATTLGTILGPMTGAISREFQGCCLEFSLSLAPYCLAALLLGAGVQVVVPPKPAWLAPVRVIAWLAGWLVWFGGGIVSFGHALS
jgi:hypothetical protein